MKTCLLLLLSAVICGYGENPAVSVEKNGVLHTFSLTGDECDPFVNRFIQHQFQSWEPGTFAVFEKVKDPEGIAIDLGAWIGTTSIWLSKNFFHVISVDGDSISVHYLRKNLELSACHNVTICDYPVTADGRPVFFGSRKLALNSSMSYVKENKTTDSDYSIDSISFRELLKNYIDYNKEINAHKVSFIKCDIEGGEEELLNELLEYARESGCKAYISFHYTWWKTKNIDAFAPLFMQFKTDCPASSVANYIKSHPFCSLLFQPQTE